MVTRKQAQCLSSWRQACSSVPRHLPWLKMLAQMHKLLDCLAHNNPNLHWDLVLQQAVEGFTNRATTVFALKAMEGALKSWHFYMLEMMERRHQLRRSLLFWMNAEVGRCFVTWEDFADERAQNEARIADARRLLLQRRMAISFADWRIIMMNPALVAALEARRPEGGPLNLEELPPPPPRPFRAGICRPEKMPLKPPWTPSKKKRREQQKNLPGAKRHPPMMGARARTPMGTPIKQYPMSGAPYVGDTAVPMGRSFDSVRDTYNRGGRFF